MKSINFYFEKNIQIAVSKMNIHGSAARAIAKTILPALERWN
jgi:hypothetical protein